MPIMDVRYPAGSLDKTAKAALAGTLTDVLIKMEGGANTHGGRAFASVFFTEFGEDDWWVGGRTDGQFVSPPGKFLVHVTIPEGYMNTVHKNEVLAWVTAAILDVAGSKSGAAPSSNGGNVQVIINEVTEGNWGNAGHPISIGSIAASVGLPKDGPRFKWVDSYFQAKARQFASAGYPADTGGLLPQADSRHPG